MDNDLYVVNASNDVNTTGASKNIAPIRSDFSGTSTLYDAMFSSNSGNSNVETVDLNASSATETAIKATNSINSMVSKFANVTNVANFSEENLSDTLDKFNSFILGSNDATGLSTSGMLGNLVNNGVISQAGSNYVNEAMKVNLKQAEMSAIATLKGFNKEFDILRLTMPFASVGLSALDEAKESAFAGTDKALLEFDYAGVITPYVAATGEAATLLATGIASGNGVNVAGAVGVYAEPFANLMKELGKAAVNFGEGFADRYQIPRVLSYYGSALSQVGRSAVKGATGAATGFAGSINGGSLLSANGMVANQIFKDAGTFFTSMLGSHSNNLNNMILTNGLNNLMGVVPKALGLGGDRVKIPQTSEDVGMGVANTLPELMLTARDTIQMALYAPNITTKAGANSSISNAFNQILDAKNVSLGKFKSNRKINVITTLGDSTSSGFGLKDYAKYNAPIVVNAGIKGSAGEILQKKLNATLNQLNMPSSRTDELLYILDPKYSKDKLLKGKLSKSANSTYTIETLDALRDTYIKAIQSSDVIMLDVGMNELMVEVMTALSDLADNKEDEKSFVEKLNENTNVINEITNYAYTWATNPEKWGQYAETLGNNVSKWCSHFAKNYTRIVNRIYELNPYAKLVIVAGYTPITDWKLVPGSIDNVIDYVISVFSALKGIFTRAVALTYPGDSKFVDMSGVELGLSNESLAYSGFNTFMTEKGSIDAASRLLETILK